METPIYDQYSDKQGYLRWFADELYPYRMRNANEYIQNDDFDYAVLIQEFHCQTFDLSKQEDLEKYRTVVQRQLDGWYTLIDLQKHWDAEHNSMKIWMEWTQNYMEIQNGQQH